jgi:hypothetical protein
MPGMQAKSTSALVRTACGMQVCVSATQHGQVIPIVPTLCTCLQAAMAAEQAKLQQKLSNSTSNLEAVQQQFEAQLQGIQNRKQRLETDIGIQQNMAEAAARLKRSQLTSVRPAWLGYLSALELEC